MNPYLAVIGRKVAGVGGGGGETCPDDASPSISVETLSNDNEFNVGVSTDSFYVGQTGYVDATTRTICKVGFFVVLGGTPSGKHYNAKIWTLSGSTLVGPIANGTSDVVTGLTTNGWKMFPWSGSKPIMTGGTSYAITLSPTEAPDVVNYLKLWVDNPTSISGSVSRWNTALGQDANFPTYSANIRIYWFA